MLFLGLCFGAQAQYINYFNIEKVGGGISSEELQTIRSIKFNNSIMMVVNESDEVVNYPLTSVRKLSFESIITSLSDASLSDASLAVFPNPIGSNERLYVHRDGSEKGNVAVEVYSIEGVLMLSVPTLVEDSFSTTALPKGMYIVLIQQGSVVKTEKIIKN